MIRAPSQFYRSGGVPPLFNPTPTPMVGKWWCGFSGGELPAWQRNARSHVGIVFSMSKAGNELAIVARFS